MAALLKIFFDISVLRGKPQDLPASVTLLVLVLALEVGISFGLDTIHPDPFVRFAASATQAGFLGVWLWLLLAWRGHPGRWLQSATALYGTSAVVTIMASLVLAAVIGLQGSEGAAVLVIAWMVVLWALAIISHVFRHALEVSPAGAFGLALVYALIGGFLVVAFPTS